MSNQDQDDDQYLARDIDRLKESFLCVAARGGRIQEVASLLCFGADVEVYSNDGDNPLLAAVRSGQQDVASLLLAHGANPAVRDGDGNTVMHLAAEKGDEGLASLFAPNVDLVHSINHDGMTALDIAVERGFSSFAEHINNLLSEADQDENTLSSLSTSQSKTDDNKKQDDNNDECGGGDVESDNLAGDELRATSFELPAASSSSPDSDSRDDGVVNEDQILIDLQARTANLFVEDSTLLAELRSISPKPTLSTSCSDTSSNNSPSKDNDVQIAQANKCIEELRRELYQAKFALSEVFTELEDQNQDLMNSQALLERSEAEKVSDSHLIEALSHKLKSMSKEYDTMKSELAIHTGGDDDSCGNINNLLAQKSLAELLSLEERAKSSLDRIIKARELASSNLEEERVCVICRENPKSVLLMNCRHLCVCSDCGHLAVLVHCPLCREIITERINAYV